jgi:hypothetical protein
VLVELDAAVVDDTCDDEADVNVGASVEVGVSVVVGAAGDVDTEVVSASPAVTAGTLVSWCPSTRPPTCVVPRNHSLAQTADAAFATVGAYPGGQSLIAQSRIPNPQFGARHRQFISFAAQLNVPAMFINLV